MNIGVFLSQYDVGGKYTTVVETFARLIAEHKHALVFGGGDEGLMHVIADVAHKNGARIVGVIREPIKHKAYKNADEIVLVKKDCTHQIKEAKDKIKKIKKDASARIKEINKQSRKDSRMLLTIQKQLYKHNEKRKKEESEVHDDNQEPEAQ